MDSVWNIRLDGRGPVYLQMIRHIKTLILRKKLVDGDRLPSRREAAAVLEVNPNTVQKAYRLMEEEGFVRTDGNQGSVIYLNEALYARIEAELTRGLTAEFVAEAKAAGLTFKRVIDLISELWEG